MHLHSAASASTTSANEQGMCSQIMLFYDFSTDDSTGMPSHVRNAIAVPLRRDSIELVYIPAGLEAEVFDRFKGTFPDRSRLESKDTALLEQSTGIADI